MLNFIKKNQTTIVYHTLGWLIFWVVEVGYGYSTEIQNMHLPRIIKNALYFVLCFYSYVFLVFLNTYSTKIKTFFWGVVMIIPLLLFKYVIDVIIIHVDLKSTFGEINYNKKYIIFEFWRVTQAILYAYAYWIYVQSLKEQKRRRGAEQRLLKTEIDFLKAQINPHFMFNTLNFVYNDINTISKKSGEAIMGLTHLMRYSVESTKHELSSLAKEMEMIEEYIHLQRLRFGDRLFVTFKKEGIFNYFRIPPLVLMSIIENAFKYGVIDDPDNPIYIHLLVNKDKLWFCCKSKKRLDFVDKETTAVGLSNIKRRLEIVYGQNFDLVANELPQSYEVELNIFWKK